MYRLLRLVRLIVFFLAFIMPPAAALEAENPGSVAPERVAAARELVLKTIEALRLPELAAALQVPEKDAGGAELNLVKKLLYDQMSAAISARKEGLISDLAYFLAKQMTLEDIKAAQAYAASETMTKQISVLQNLIKAFSTLTLQDLAANEVFWSSPAGAKLKEIAVSPDAEKLIEKWRSLLTSSIPPETFEGMGIQTKSAQ